MSRSFAVPPPAVPPPAVPPPAVTAPAADTLPPDHPLVDGRTTEAPLVRAYRGQPVDRHPVWFMRQAGRSLPEYRAVRAGTGMLDACLTPELAAEITVQPVRRHGVDAAIFFSDIVVPLRLAGVDVQIVPGTGPVVAEPVRTAGDVAALVEPDSTPVEPDSALDPSGLAPIAEATAAVVQMLASEGLGTTPLIGFAGAPFTVASYLVEGGPSREHLRTKALMHADPASWHRLAGWVAGLSAAFLRAQVLAGASAVQLFDSWAGFLSRADYAEFVAPHSAAVFAAVADLGVPRVHFGVGTGELLADMRAVGADVVGVDHRVLLDDAITRLGGGVPVQGNIDPAMLFAGAEALHAHTRDVLRRGAAAPGHVVNLGHGVPPDTDPDVLTRLVGFIHDQP